MHSEKEGWREIKRKRIAAKSVGAPIRLVKPTRPSQSSSRFIPQTIFSFFLCDFHQKPFLTSENVSFVHMRGWSRNWDSSWSPVTLLGIPIFHLRFPIPVVSSLIFEDSVREINFFQHSVILYFIPNEKYQVFGEELILHVRLNTVPEDKFSL